MRRPSGLFTARGLSALLGIGIIASLAWFTYDRVGYLPNSFPPGQSDELTDLNEGLYDEQLDLEACEELTSLEGEHDDESLDLTMESEQPQPEPATMTPEEPKKEPDPMKREERLRRLIPENIRDILRSPDRVVAYRIVVDDDINVPFDQLKMELGPVEVPADIQRELAELLVDTQTYGKYLDGWGKACVPIWRYRVSIARGDQELDLYLCPGCGDMKLFASDGSYAMGADFEDKRLVEIIASLFPKDDRSPE